MNALTLQRCFNHNGREAVALCPECGRYYCRECVTEHDDRVLCAACLSRLSIAPSAQSRRWSGIIRIGRLVSGSLIIWLFFFYLGQILLSMPNDFHEGTMWQTQWWEDK